MARYSSTGTGLGGCIAAVFVFVCYVAAVFGIPVSLVAIWTQRNLEFWLSVSHGHAEHVSYGLAWLCSIPYPLAFVVNIIAEIVRMFHG